MAMYLQWSFHCDTVVAPANARSPIGWLYICCCIEKFDMHSSLSPSNSLCPDNSIWFQHDRATKSDSRYNWTSHLTFGSHGSLSPPAQPCPTDKNGSRKWGGGGGEGRGSPQRHSFNPPCPTIHYGRFYTDLEIDTYFHQGYCYLLT